MWDAQVPEVTKKFRVLRYDKRGHGQSSAPPGPYTIEQLGRDALALLDSLHFEQVHFCGLSIGGQTGMWLGAERAAAAEETDPLQYRRENRHAGSVESADRGRTQRRHEGGESAAVIERWFTAGFRAKEPDEITKIQRVLESANTGGYVGCCAAVRDFDVREKLSAIRTPTLVIAGTHDPATTAADGRWAAEQIPGARYVELDAAHLSNIEARDRFTAEISQFLAA